MWFQLPMRKIILVLVLMALVSTALAESADQWRRNAFDDIAFVAMAEPKYWTFRAVTAVSGGKDLEVGFVKCVHQTSALLPMGKDLKMILSQGKDVRKAAESGDRMVVGPERYLLLFSRSRECPFVLSIFPDGFVALSGAEAVDTGLGIYQPARARHGGVCLKSEELWVVIRTLWGGTERARSGTP
jgi:hypothetical protein